MSPVISRINSLRTDSFLPKLAGGDFSEDEIEKKCRVDAKGQVVCDTLIGELPTDCKGNSVPAGSGRSFCLRVPRVIPGRAVILEGFNFFSEDARVRVTGPQPSNASTEVEAHVVGDAKTPVKETVGGVEHIIADSRVRDIITFKVPAVKPGIYTIEIVIPVNTENGSNELKSGEQFIEVIPDPQTTFQIVAEALEPILETDCLLPACRRIFSDDVGLRFIGVRMELDGAENPLPPIILSKSNFSPFGQVDSCGEPCKSPIDLNNRVLFNGNNFSALALSIIGHEIDNDAAFEQQTDGYIDSLILILKQILPIALGVATVGKLILPLLLPEGLITSGAVAVAAAILAIGVLLVAIWAPADLIIQDAIALDTTALATLTDSEIQLPAGSFRTQKGIGVEILPLSKSSEVLPSGKANNIYRERRKYTSKDEGSRYDLILRYNRFDP